MSSHIPFYNGIYPSDELLFDAECRPAYMQLDSFAASFSADPNDETSERTVPFVASQRHREFDDEFDFSVDTCVAHGFATRIGVVTPGVLVGSYRCISDPSVTGRYGIGALVCAAAELIDVPRPAHLTDLPLLSLPLSDTAEQDLAVAVDTATSFINAQRAEGRTVAIYCRAGQSRSVSIALGFLLTTDPSRDVNQVLSNLREGYVFAEPNLFFLRQLEDYCASLTSPGDNVAGLDGQQSRPC